MKGKSSRKACLGLKLDLKRPPLGLKSPPPPTLKKIEGGLAPPEQKMCAEAYRHLSKFFVRYWIGSVDLTGSCPDKRVSRRFLLSSPRNSKVDRNREYINFQ